LSKLIFLCLKIDEFLAFVTDFHRSVSLAAAPQLLWQELLSFIFGSTYLGRLYPGMARGASVWTRIDWTRVTHSAWTVESL